MSPRSDITMPAACDKKRRPYPPGVDDTGLSIERAIPELRAALASRPSAVLVAAPGSGKTTVVPLRLLDEPLAGRAARSSCSSRGGSPPGPPPSGWPTSSVSRWGDGRLRHSRRPPGRSADPHRGDHRGCAHPQAAAGPRAGGHRARHLRRAARTQPADRSRAGAGPRRPATLRPDLRLLAMSATIDADRIAALLGGDDPAPIVVGEAGEHPVESAGSRCAIDVNW